MSISVKSRKAKSRNLQNWVAKEISKLLDIPWGHEDNSLIEPRLMGQSGVDVILRGEAAKLFKYDIECKSSETWNVPAAIRQVRKNQKKGCQWLVFLKRKEVKKPVVVVDAEHFFELHKTINHFDEICVKCKHVKKLEDI